MRLTDIPMIVKVWPSMRLICCHYHFAETQTILHAYELADASLLVQIFTYFHLQISILRKIKLL